ncbi:RHS repeat-associated core domain-containing protein [Asanoa sp. NPDC049573]|uniref:RHS repeat-associated core domain-containing protein n=1 Tax=Asanoa sp. NPDC049573 TaxID=3155396 RepID=UPI003439C709
MNVRDRSGVPSAWRNGVVLELTRGDEESSAAKANVAIDYSGFATAFGGDWAARLRLVSLPACALTTPEVPACAPAPLATRNDATSRRVSADVALGATGTTLVALTAGPTGPTGDFTATSLQGSSTWSAGGNSGTFTWNYPLRTPPSLGGPSPAITLAYSSAAVDGRSEATNNQPSWVGEGFDWWPGYIERRYKPCADDGVSTGDQCWGTDNATLSMNGSGGELVKDASGLWRVKDDDGSKVEHLTQGVNGDDDGEYWKVTTANGTQYFFGRNRLPGYTGTAPANKTTGSTWTVPVAGDDDHEPCHGSSFVSSFCQQAWRWNLDYVVDVHGNTMSLFYGMETNKYARNNTASDTVSYTRGGFLDHIDYGTDNRSGTDTENTSTAAPMRVSFATADRCLSSCSSHDSWKDTPLDQECTGSTCVGQYAPTFWTTKRLAAVTTQVWDSATSKYKDVDAWTLTHNFPDPGDGTRAGMWLDSISHKGKAVGPAVTGGDVTLPDVNFDWAQRPNRVDSTTDGKFPMNWMRMSTIWTDTGGKISVRYTDPECVPGSRMPSKPENNTLRCYPVLEKQPDGSLIPVYFHKYLVTTVTQEDRTNSSPDVVTSYEYVGTPAWRHTDDDGITKDNLRTWSDYRGYAQVNTRVGDPGSGTETLSTTSYFRGIHGDLNGSGGTRSVSLPAVDVNGDGDTTDAADAPAVKDEDAYAGMSRQTTVFNGVVSAPVSTTVFEPWQSAPTASRNMGQTTSYARFTGTKTTWAGTALAAGGWRVSRADTTFDSYGMTSQVDDQGDLAVSGDEQCTKTTYGRNAGINLLDPTSRVEKYALRCATAPSSDADVIADARTSFDGKAYGTPPTKGDATQAERAASWTAASGPAWQTISTAAFDPSGRQTDLTDVRGNNTHTDYSPASGGPVTSQATTTPLGKTTTTLEPAWGTPTAVVDNNGKRTEATFDALGRTLQVWQANRPRAQFPAAPSVSYTYQVLSSGGFNAVTTATLNAASSGTDAYYTTSYALFDGLLRPRQTQTASVANDHTGTVFSETKYDALGRAISQSQHFDETVQPSTTLFTIADWQPKTQTVSVYDRAGRTVASVFRSAGDEKWRTTTTFGGDRVSVLPPNGGTATTTINDAQGRTVELRQYHDRASLGSNTRSLYDAVTYHFNRKGQQDLVTDNAGNKSTYTFDFLGRQTASRQPDKGDTSTKYTAVGDVDTTTDARGTLAYQYDSLGRRTGEYAGSVATANKLATWAYDPFGAKGQLASSSRWLSGGTQEYKVKVHGYTDLYQPTGEDYVIPTTLTGLSGTYAVGMTYRFNGSPDSITYPAGGGLDQETVTYTYDKVTGLPEMLKTNSGQAQYVSNTDYTAYGELAFVQYQLQAGAWLQRTFKHDDATHRLKQATTLRETTPQAVDDTQYKQDEAGNFTKITSTSSTGAVDTQCFGYDYVGRLTEGWTPASNDCDQPKAASSLGGPAPYWLSWTFDSVGNRASQTNHGLAGDTKTDYAYPAATSAQPHTLTATTTGATTQSYGYDATGNTTCRPAGTTANSCPSGTGSQTLTWDAEDHLGSVTDATGTNRYTYTADGTRLTADGPSSTTLYLPNMELKRTKSTGVVSATRYYTWAGQTCAMMTTGGQVTWLVTDQQNTQTIAVAAGNQAITTRRQLPFGETRGSAPSWPNAKGFVGGDKDPSGLTHVGAREYDPSIGRFISADPVFDGLDPQSLTGYAYAANTPVTSTDPTGKMRDYDGRSDGGSASSTTGSSSHGGNCNYSNAKAVDECQHSQHASADAESARRAAQTTKQKNSNPCYELAMEHVSCDPTKDPGAQLAQYKANVDSENRTRQAQINAQLAALDAARERQAQKNSCSGLFGCVNQWMSDNSLVVGIATGVLVGGFCLLATAGAGSLGCLAVGGLAAGWTASMLEGDDAGEVATFTVLGGALEAALGLAVSTAAATTGVELAIEEEFVAHTALSTELHLSIHGLADEHYDDLPVMYQKTQTPVTYGPRSPSAQGTPRCQIPALC